MIRGRRTRINYAKDFEYTTNDTATLVTKYIGNKTDVVVPSKINGKPVVLQNTIVDSSGSGAYNGVFAENQNIKSVKFEEGVSIVNDNMSWMFYNCYNLVNAPAIPVNVTNMGETFFRCYNLVNAPIIPTNVTNMYYTFGYGNLVNAPIIPANVTNMGWTFFRCYNLVNAPVIPANVTSMPYTFCGCRNLINAPVIPANVTNMRSTFSSCYRLVDAPTIPANVTDMTYTFKGCTNLVTAPIIPMNVGLIPGIFDGCVNLVGTFNVPANVKDMRYAFRNCDKITGNIKIASNRINNTSMENCFYGTTLPKNVYIPSQGYNAIANTWNAAFNTTYGINGKNGVTVIDDAALDWTYTTNDTATLLTKYTGTKADVAVPATLAAKPTMLSTAVFEGTNVNSVDLANTQFVNNDMANTFNGCTNLKSVTNLTNTVNAMNHAFNNAINLKTVSKFNATSSIRMSNGYMAFSNCTNLTSVPNIGIIASAANVSTNVAYAFHNCSNLLNVNMPLFGIRVYGRASTFNGYKTFANCCSLTALETMGITIIGNSNLSNMFQNTGISSLGNLSNDRGEDFGFSVIGNANMNGAFVGCKNLSTANFSSAIFDEGDANVNMPFVFYNCQNLVNVVNLPNGARNLSFGFANCLKLNDVTRLPETVNDISCTFSNCTNLKTAIDISDSVYTMQGTYKGCTNLTNVPITSVSLNTQNMDSAFENCYKLTKASIIPPNVTGMRSVFRNCTNLTGNVVIYTNKLTNGGMSNAFNGTSVAKNVYVYNQGFNAIANTWNSAINTTSGVNGKNGVTLVNMGTWENACWEHSGGYTTRYVGSSAEVFVPATLSGQVTTLRHAGRYSSNAPFYSKRLNIKVIKFQSGVKYDGDNMTNAFRDHTGLVAVYGIPSSVTSVWNTFQGCSNLTKVSSIPSSVTQLHNTFAYCTSLVNAPSLKNLANLTDMEGAFCGCSNLKNIDCIPNKVADITRTFLDCTSLVNAPDITNRTVSYFNMRSAFENCTSLVKAPNLTGTNVYAMDNAFKNCSNLKNVPKSLPNSIYIINGAFINCTSLVNAPVIPNGSLRFMVSTFKGCTNLTGNIIIKANGISSAADFPGARDCFSNTMLPKNVYIPFQGIDTAFNTYNAFKGWNGQNGVTIYDINTYKG